jgi:hypothetical protein
VRQFYRFRCTNTEITADRSRELCLIEAREIACGRESAIMAEKFRIAHGGPVDFDFNAELAYSSLDDMFERF